MAFIVQPRILTHCHMNYPCNNSQKSQWQHALIHAHVSMTACTFKFNVVLNQKKLFLVVFSFFFCLMNWNVPKWNSFYWHKISFQALYKLQSPLKNCNRAVLQNLEWGPSNITRVFESGWETIFQNSCQISF